MPSLEEILLIVGDQDRPESERRDLSDVLYKMLYPTVKEYVGRCIYHFRLQCDFKLDVEEVTHDALVYLLIQVFRGKFDPRKARHAQDAFQAFQAWWRTVVRNFIWGLIRASGPHTVPLSSENHPPEPLKIDPREIIEQIATPLREEMNAFILWYNAEKKRSHASHFPSVIWLRLRVVIDVIYECSVPEQFVPWHKHEESWQFQALWPTILEIWKFLSHEKRYGSQEIADVISADLDNKVNAGYWNSQVSRAIVWVETCHKSMPVPIMRILLIR